jgi:hypothetical protein
MLLFTESLDARTYEIDKNVDTLKRLRFSVDIKDLRSFQCVEPRRGLRYFFIYSDNFRKRW